MARVAAGIGLVMALAFGVLVLPQVSTVQTSIEGVSAVPSTFSESIAGLFLIVVAGVVGVGTILGIAAFLKQ